MIENNAPSVQQFYKEDELTTKAPPSLRGEGNKIQHDWLFNFLKHVEDLRPLLYSAPASKPGIRMPSFPITDDEATALAAYFAAASQKEAKTLDKTLANIRKYIGVRHEAAMKPVSGRPANPTTMPAAAAKTLVESLINHAGALIADRDYAAARSRLAPLPTVEVLLRSATCRIACHPSRRPKMDTR